MDYLIVGAGPAGVIAAETLRDCDPDGAITIVGSEPEQPYSRMALPYMLAEDVGEEGTYLRHGAGHFGVRDIAVRQGEVASLAPGEKAVTLKDGARLSYDKLLLATGSHAARPPIPGMDLPAVENCWTLEDARAIAAKTKAGSKVVLMGAGFIGCIVLEALAERKVELTVVEMADRMLPRMMDNTGGEMIKRWCESKGVRVLTATGVQAITENGSAVKLSLDDGGSLDADLVVCATGVRPNTAFLEGSGVKTDRGVLVDHRMQTSVADIFAAGDVAQGPDFSTGEQEIHAIQPTASEHGRIAAMNMAGRSTQYRGSLSMNVLNTLGLVSASFGLWMGVEGGDSASAVDNDRFSYLRLAFRDDVLVGSLSLGLTQHVGVLRGLIQTEVKLGPWKDRLLKDPHQVMSAYLECTQGSVAPNARGH